MDDTALVAYVNRKQWWHVPPLDPDAYALRGKFYASSFREAEFYGRPESEPTRVKVSNPLVGDEVSILSTLFSDKVSVDELDGKEGLVFIKARLSLDSRMKQQAKGMGYDSIILMTHKCYSKYVRSGKIPRSLELNTFAGA